MAIKKNVTTSLCLFSEFNVNKLIQNCVFYCLFYQTKNYYLKINQIEHRLCGKYRRREI
ncbi:hypothetical protein PTUN_a2335 [Pseudoalteromonas tunicata]|nr:hypothetical protein PTUN_a2335 [Pseudoalteromonas tunicata]